MRDLNVHNYSLAHPSASVVPKTRTPSVKMDKPKSNASKLPAKSRASSTVPNVSKPTGLKSNTSVIDHSKIYNNEPEQAKSRSSSTAPNSIKNPEISSATNGSKTLPPKVVEKNKSTPSRTKNTSGTTGKSRIPVSINKSVIEIKKIEQALSELQQKLKQGARDEKKQREDDDFMRKYLDLKTENVTLKQKHKELSVQNSVLANQILKEQEKYKFFPKSISVVPTSVEVCLN